MTWPNNVARDKLREPRWCPLTPIHGARFKRPVEPGDQLILEVELLRMKAGIFKFKAIAMVQEELAVEAELMCTMRRID